MTVPADPSKPLSSIERTVLVYLARGLENQEIADLSYRSVETIRSHVKSILRKLEATNRTHAVAIAYHTGLFLDSQKAAERRHAA